MTSMTPIRVRGKRGAPKELKWHSGKRRKTPRPGSTTGSERNSSARSTPSAGSIHRRRRKAWGIELSQLEQLPTEVLQAIFEYSANLGLPLASPRLASQLASRHLYHSLTSIVLQPVFDNNVPTNSEALASMRLMNSKFFTWPFFQSWLHGEFERRHLLCDWQNHKSRRHVEQQEEWTWHMLRHSSNLAPPLKLLQSPFTPDKTRLLRFFATTFRAHPQDLSPVYLERAKDGLEEAVSEGARDILFAFWTLGMQPTTELLRQAVIDAGCDEELVRELVRGDSCLGSDPIDIDFLDPTLWSWAEKAQASGNEKGRWLKDLLKDAARQSGRKDAEIKHASSTPYE